MKAWSFARYGFGIAAAAALLAGCSAAGTQSSFGGGSAIPSARGVGQVDAHALAKAFQMTNPRHALPPVQHLYGGKSWMSHVRPGDTLAYASDVEYGTVDVVDVNTGALVGQATGFEYPYGSCSDSSGNVYVTDFDSGYATELAAGTTNAIATFTTAPYTIGCSVSKTGDVAFTNFYTLGPSYSLSPGTIDIYPHGGGSPTIVTGPAAMWPAGYDKKGNLFVEGNYTGSCTSPCVAELPAGGGSFNLLTFNKTIGFPGPTQLLGKKIGFTDQDAGGPSSFVGGFYPSKVKGSKATSGKAIVFAGGACDSGTYQGFSGSIGEVSKHEDGLQMKKVTGFVSGNDDCFPSPIDVYGAHGGAPTSEIAGGSFGLPYDYYYALTITN